MISKPLFQRELKANYKLFLIIIAVISLYESVVIAMFDPTMGDSLRMMSESMPDLFAAFGMVGFSTILIDFIAELLYGFILIVIPMVFIILLTNKLVVRYIDRGSMAYLLATPNTRKKVIVTQAIFSMIVNLTLVIYIVLLGIVVSQILFPGELDIDKFLLLNFGLYSLLFFMSGLCFFSACIFNDTKLCSGVGAGLCILFMVLKMLGQVSENSKVFTYMTPVTLFDAMKLITLDSAAIGKLIVLLAGGILLYFIGIVRFQRKDLSL